MSHTSVQKLLLGLKKNDCFAINKYHLTKDLNEFVIVIVVTITGACTPSIRLAHEFRARAQLLNVIYSDYIK